MSMLERQVERAQRRLTTNVLMERCAKAIIAGAVLWSLAVVVERTFSLGMPFWLSVWIASGLAAVITLIGTVLGRVNRLQAAVVLDGAASLKERLSTALICRNSPDEFARAAVDDAERIAGRVHVPAVVPLRAPQVWPWSAAALCVAVLLGAFMPTLSLFARDPEAKTPPVDRQAVAAERKNVTAAVNQQMNKIKEMAKENPQLAELAKDLKPLEIPEQARLTPEDVRREAIKQIDSMAEKLERQADGEKLKSLDEFKNMLAKLQQRPPNDPTSKLTNSLMQGDMKAAKESLEDIKKQLADASKNADEQGKQKAAELQQKLDELSKELSKAAEQQQAQKDLEHKAGMSSDDAKKLLDQMKNMDAKQIEKELQKALGEKGLSQQQLQELAKKIVESEEARKQCQGLAEALNKAAQAGQKGQEGQPGADSDAAQAALSEAAGQLSDMEMAEQMMNELEGQLGELKQLRQGVCQGTKPGEPGDQVGGQGPQLGQGFGATTGKEKKAHKMAPVKAPSQMRGGEIIGQMLLDGPQVRGEANAAVREAVNSAVRDATDAIEREQVSRQHARVVREYFEGLAGLMQGQGGEKAEAAKPEKPAENDKDEKDE